MTRAALFVSLLFAAGCTRPAEPSAPVVVETAKAGQGAGSLADGAPDAGTGSPLLEDGGATPAVTGEARTDDRVEQNGADGNPPDADGGTSAPSHVVYGGPDLNIAFDASCNTPSDCAFTELIPELRCPTLCANPGLIVNKRELPRVKALYAKFKISECPVARCRMPMGSPGPTCVNHVCGARPQLAP